MTKGAVEKYQQVLKNDPGSLVFVELAKALLDQGDAAQAIQVCKKSLEYHPDSIIGLVLWGRGLIARGRPAEAMEQFERAISLNREQPEAYLMIGEVLLQKKLYRSALPLVKRAATLLPGDQRVQQLLEQVQRGIGQSPSRASPPKPTIKDSPVASSLASSPGGSAFAAPEPTGQPLLATAAANPVQQLDPQPDPQPVKRKSSADAGKKRESEPGLPVTPVAIDTVAASPVKTSDQVNQADESPIFFGEVPAATPSAALASDAAPPSEPAENQPANQAQDTYPVLNAKAGGIGEGLAWEPPAAPSVDLSGASAQSNRSDQPEKAAKNQVPSVDETASSQATAPQPEGDAQSSLPSDWFSPPVLTTESVPSSESASTNDSLSAAPAAPAAPAASSTGELLAFVPSPSDESAGMQSTNPDDSAGASAPADEQPTSPHAQIDSPAVPSIPEETPTEPAADGDLPPDLSPYRSRLLPELPTQPPPVTAAKKEETVSVVIAPDAAANIAKEYERELRERLLNTEPPSFWRKNWLFLSLGVVLLIVAGVGFAFYKNTRVKNRKVELSALRSQMFRAVGLGTPAGYYDTIELANRVLAIGEDDEAQSVLAYSNAVLYQLKQQVEYKEQAEKLLSEIGKKHPGFALTIPYLVASTPAAKESAKKSVLEAADEQLPKGFEGAEVLALAGRLLLAADKTEDAFAHFQAAIKIDPANVSTLLALGNYYLSQGEADQALRFFVSARGTSAENLLALLGMIEANLDTGADDIEIVNELDQAKNLYSTAEQTPAAWPKAYRANLDLVEGRVLALQDKLAQAVVLLGNGATEYTERATDFYAALGSIEILAGNQDKAEAAFRKALNRRPNDSALMEQMARALIAQGRVNEVIKLTDKAKPDDRRLRVVRGLARLEMGQHAKAREELLATQRKGKVLTEAGIYLAMIDAATGQRETAFKVLENTAKTMKNGKGRGALHVALARMLSEDGRKKEAMAEYALAEEDRLDWEGACSLGRHYLAAGKFADARTHLTVAVQRNKQHLEARVSLGEALLALGEAKKAQTEFEAALALNRSEPSAHRGVTKAALAQGLIAEARQHALMAWKLEHHSKNARLLAQVALASGDTNDAIKTLDRLAKMSPRDPLVWCELGELLLKLDNNAGAERAFASALKIDRANVRGRLGILASALPKQAKKVVKDAETLVKELESAEPTYRAWALAVNSQAHLALTENKAAIALAKQAVQTDDSSAQAHLAYGMAAIAARNDQLANKELSRVVTLDPTIAQARFALATVLARAAGQEARSLAEYEAYLRMVPKGADAVAARKAVALLQSKIEKDGSSQSTGRP